MVQSCLKLHHYFIETINNAMYVELSILIKLTRFTVSKLTNVSDIYNRLSYLLNRPYAFVSSRYAVSPYRLTNILGRLR